MTCSLSETIAVPILIPNTTTRNWFFCSLLCVVEMSLVGTRSGSYMKDVYPTRGTCFWHGRGQFFGGLSFFDELARAPRGLREPIVVLRMHTSARITGTSPGVVYCMYSFKALDCGFVAILLETNLYRHSCRLLAGFRVYIYCVAGIPSPVSTNKVLWMLFFWQLDAYGTLDYVSH